MGKNRKPQDSPSGGGNIGEYIGFPTTQYGSVRNLTQGELLKEDMEHRIMVARLTPMLPDIKIDHNIYRGKLAIRDFEKDLLHNTNNMCESLKRSGELKIVLSTMVPITESYQNEYGSSELLSGLSGVLSGGMMAELQQFSGSDTATDMISKAYKGAMATFMPEEMRSQINDKLDTLKGKGQDIINAMQTELNKTDLGKGVISLGKSLAHAANRPASKIDWPLLWKNCSFQQQYEITTRLWCYNTANAQEYANNIIAPIAALQMFVCPRSDDGFLYNWPYLTTFDIYGCVHMPMAYISNLSIIKGGDVGDFSASGRPNIVDLRFTVNSLYGVCVNAPVSEENNNPYRPSISKDQRGLNSYRNWGDKISPNLDDSGSAGKSDDPDDNESVADLYTKAQQWADELNKANPNAERKAEATDFFYAAKSDKGVEASRREIQEAIAKNMAAEQAAAAAAKNAAKAAEDAKRKQQMDQDSASSGGSSDSGAASTDAGTTPTDSGSTSGGESTTKSLKHVHRNEWDDQQF